MLGLGSMRISRGRDLQNRVFPRLPMTWDSMLGRDARESAPRGADGGASPPDGARIRRVHPDLADLGRLGVRKREALSGKGCTTASKILT